jgi:hypothetical protein
MKFSFDWNNIVLYLHMCQEFKAVVYSCFLKGETRSGRDSPQKELTIILSCHMILVCREKT